MLKAKKINISKHSRVPKLKPLKKKSKKKHFPKKIIKIKKHAFGVENKLKLLKVDVKQIADSITPLGIVKNFGMSSLKAHIRRMNAVSAPIRATDEFGERERLPVKIIKETDKQKILTFNSAVVPERLITLAQQSAGRILLNPSDSGFYGFNGYGWTPFKTPTYPFATILATSNDAGGQDILNVGTLQSAGVSVSFGSVQHIHLDYWYLSSTLNVCDQNILNVDNLIANNISTSLYIGNYSSYERLSTTTTINPNIVYTLIDKGTSIDFDWSAQIAKISNNNYGASDINKRGDLVVASTYTTLDLQIYNSDAQLAGTLEFNGAGGTWVSTSGFLVKYNSNGDFDWGVRMRNLLSRMQVRGVSINNIGDIAVIGTMYSNTLNIYNTTDTLVYQNYFSETGAFVVKWDANGTLQWFSKLIGDATGYSVAINDYAETIAIGIFGTSTLTIDFNTISGGSFPSQTLSGTAGNLFLVKYSNAGINWANRIAATIYNDSIDVSINGNGFIVATASYYLNPVTFYSVGNIASTVVLPDYGGGFVVKYSSSGNYIWSSYISNGFCQSVKQNDSNVISVSGVYINELQAFSPNSVIPKILPNVGGNPNTFLLKYFDNGTVDWAVRVNNSPPIGNTISRTHINDFSEFVLIGNYGTPSCTIYNSSGSISFALIGNAFNTFIVNYSSSGNFMRAARLSSESSLYNFGVNLKNTEEVICTGINTNTLQIYEYGGTLNVRSISTIYDENVFIIKYNSNVTNLLGNPIVDGQTKIIASSGPKANIKPIATVNEEQNKTIVLRENQRVKLLWNEVLQNWIVQNNSGDLI